MFSEKTKLGISKYLILCTAAVLMLAVSGSLYGQVTQQDAKDLVLKEVLAEQIGEVDVYISKNIVQKDAGLALWRKELSCNGSTGNGISDKKR